MVECVSLEVVEIVLIISFEEELNLVFIIRGL